MDVTVRRREESCWNNFPIMAQYVQITNRHQPYLFWLFFSSDAMQRYVILCSSSAGRHCCLWWLMCCQCFSHHQSLHLKGTERGNPWNKRGENMMLSMKIHPLQNMDTTYGTILHKKTSSGTNLIFPPVLWYAFSYCVPLLAVGGTVVQAHCVIGVYSPLRLYVRCQLRHSNFLKVIIESHNVFKHEFTRNPRTSTMTSVRSVFNFTSSVIKPSRSLWYYFLPRTHSTPIPILILLQWNQLDTSAFH